MNPKSNFRDFYLKSKTIFNTRILIIFIFTNLFIFKSFAQKGSAFRVYGIVLDKKSQEPIPGVAVIIKSIGTGLSTDKNGFFMVGAQENDTLIFKILGFDQRKIPVRYFLNAEDTVKIKIDQEVRSLSEVTITDERFIPNVNTTVSPYKSIASESSFSPLTALYESFSKRHQSFKKVEALVQNDEREWYVMRRLTLKHLRTMIPIKESEYYDFIDYCHFSIKYIKTATEYELIVEVKRLYEDFKP